MDSPPTTPMLMSREIKVLHLEPTDVCQAACPACSREIDISFDKKQQHHLSIEQIMVHVNDDAIRNLDKMFMCGIYGDPAAGRYTLPIYKYFRGINPKIVLGMNTNGAIQNAAWWQTLGGIFHGQRDYVVFSIDGLEDTNHVYRRNVCWDKLIENVQSFISTGAHAHWDMLVYRHNEHQVSECEKLARSLGFKWFRAKVSKRALYTGLEYPLNWNPPMVYNNTINCHALQDKSIYIDAQGRQSPCCWLGGRQYDFIHDLKEVMPSWNTNTPNSTCLSACGQNNDKTNFAAQWRREIELC